MRREPDASSQLDGKRGVPLILNITLNHPFHADLLFTVLTLLKASRGFKDIMLVHWLITAFVRVAQAI